MSTQRWHVAPRPSPALLLIPAVALVAGIYLSLRWTTTGRPVPAKLIRTCFSGSFTILEPIVSSLTFAPLVTGLKSASL